MIYYTDDLASVREDMLDGFFVGWPQRPSPAQHLAVLRGSFRSVVAIDDAASRVVGFVNMLSDGVLTAFIPWLEVLPGYQGQGVGGLWRGGHPLYCSRAAGPANGRPRPSRCSPACPTRPFGDGVTGRRRPRGVVVPPSGGGGPKTA